MRAIALALALVSVVAAGCGVGAPAPAGISAVASFHVLAEFAARVGADRVAVRTLTPPGGEPHDFEPTPKDIAALERADVVVYNGAGFEPWADRVLPRLPPRIVRVNATEGLPLLRGAGGATDPHVWLDPILAAEQVARVARGLAAADPGGRRAYDADAAVLVAELRSVDDEYRTRLARCRRRDFVTAHAAFGYLARRYGLEMIAIAGLSPEFESSPAAMREIVRVARERGVRVVYVETLTSPRAAEAIAREVGARTLVLDPLEGPSGAEGARGYAAVMRENLDRLAEGLDCA